MENWQKEHIRQNLVELIESIKCHDKLMDYLISQGCLAKPERCLINGCGHDDEAKARQLLKTIETRISAYQCLARALYICGQTGALINLLYGVEANITSSNSFKYCGIDLDTARFLSMPVKFGGSTLPLGEICSNVHNIQNIIADHLNVTIFRKLISGNGVVITMDTIPKKLPYYIQRSILIRTKLDEKFFSEMVSDVFLIEAIEWHLLTQLAAKHAGGQTQGKLTDRSSNQLDTLTVRFILLDSPGHFQKISANCRQNVHWIQHRNGAFHHVKTSGKDMISFVHNFVSDSNENILSQTQFLSSCLVKPGQIITILYDSPGMGKSVLLAELAREVQKLHPAYIVVWMHCSELTKTQNASINKTPTIENLKEAIIKMITVNKFGGTFLKEICTISFYLFLDGFDELSSKDQKLCICILKCIEKCPDNLKVVITSRNNGAECIESVSGVLGYNILPFQEPDQVSFFLQYWNKKHSIPTNSAVTKVAKYCINTFSSALSSDEREIAGIPLQCRMLADIYADDAKSCGVTNCGSSESVWMHPECIVKSVFNLYENYFSVKFSLLKSEEEKEHYLHFHYEQAIKFIFRKAFVGLETGVHEATLYRVGIMELRNGKPAFVHRTFAEFLSAKFVMSVIFDESSKVYEKAFQSRLIPAVFSTIQIKVVRKFFSIAFSQTFDEIHFREKTVHFFLNNFLKNNLKNIFSGKVIGALAATDYLCFSEAAIANNCEYTFEFLISWYVGLNVINFESVVGQLTLDTKSSELARDLLDSHNQAMISLAAEYCSVSVVDKLCNLMLSIGGKKWCELKYDTINNPLILSIRRGNYQIVEYFITISEPQYLVGLGALHHCIEDSCEDSDITIANKVQIIKLLLQQEERFLTEVVGYTYAHLTSCANFRLIKQLIEAGAPLNATTSCQENLGHTAAWYCSENEYHELVTILIAKGYQDLFKRRDLGSCTPLHYALRRLDIWTETLDLLVSKCQVTFNNASSFFSTEIHEAMAFGSQRVLEDILRLGGDFKSSYPKSALYVAVEWGNWNASNWLLSLGVDVNSWNMVGGQSPLFAAIERNNTEMVTLLVSKGANVNVFCCENELNDFKGQLDSMLKRWKSPLQYANSRETNPEIIEMLKSSGARDCCMIPCYCSPCWLCCCLPCVRYWHFGSIC